MNKTMLDDIKYRIENLKAAITHNETLSETPDTWEDGYRCAALLARESELRFLEGLEKTYNFSENKC